MLPQKLSRFLKIAYGIGEYREIMGIYYPSDEETARVLAHRVLEVMWLQENFHAYLEQVWQEWKYAAIRISVSAPDTFILNHCLCHSMKI